MANWIAYKGEGPWPFVKQGEKPHYNEGIRIAHAPYLPGGTPVWPMNNPDYSVGGIPITPIHRPWCGYWINPLSGGTPDTPEEAPIDDIYIVHNAPLSGPTRTDDRCYKRSKGMDEIIWYGGPGNGIDELQCPFSVAVDGTYAWITDRSNSRLMKRLKSDLTHVTHRDSYERLCVHAGSGSVIYTGTSGLLEELDKTSLDTLRSIAWPGSGVEGYIAYAFDITSDDSYLYVADSSNHRVAIYDISTLAFVTEFGKNSCLICGASGVVKAGGYLYVSDYVDNKVYKMNTSYAILASVGHTNGGGTAGDNYFNDPGNLAADSTRLFVPSTSGKVSVRLLSDLSFVANVTDQIVSPVGCCVDTSYLYVADQGGLVVSRYNASTYAYVDENGDRSGDTWDGEDAYSTIMSIAIDDTHLYVLDQGDALRVIKRLKSDLSYVDEYRDDDWAIFSNPQGIGVDDTYIYVTDADYIRRINKSTLAYVDSIALSDTGDAQQIYIDGTDIFIANYGTGTGLQRYLLSDMSLIDQAPATNPDSDFWMLDVDGITCDENFIYIADGLANKIRIYNKGTYTYVDEFSVPSYIYHIAVDDTYLYAAIYADYPNSFSKKYLKASPYTEVDSADEDHATGIDTAYLYQV